MTYVIISYGPYHMDHRQDLNLKANTSKDFDVANAGSNVTKDVAKWFQSIAYKELR